MPDPVLPGPPSAGADRADLRDRWWLVMAAGLAVFMATMDMSIVSVALPRMERDFGVPTSSTEWVLLSYLLPLVALVLPSGRWLAQVGTRSALVFSTVGFAIASAAAAAAPGLAGLIGARVVQGLFAAVLFPLVPALATVAVRDSKRGRAMSIVATVGPLGAVSGPVVGGMLTQALGWPWIFLINLPISLAIVTLALAQLPADEPLRRPDRTWVAEALLLGSAAALVMFGLSRVASHGPIWSALILGAAVPVVRWQRMSASRPVRELLTIPGISGPHAALLAFATAAGAVQLLVPFYLLQVLHTSPATAGLAMLALPLGMVLLAPVAGALTDRWGPRPTATIGLAILTAGLLLLAQLNQAWEPQDLAWRLAIVGMGGGLFNTPNLTMAMTHSPHHLLTTTGATTSMARQLGFALGPALATTIWAASGYTILGMRVGIGLTSGACLVAILVVSGQIWQIRTRSPHSPRVAGARNGTDVDQRQA